MAANVAVTQDPAGNLKPAKDKSTERIDGIVALIMAIGRAMVAQEEPQHLNGGRPPAGLMARALPDLPRRRPALRPRRAWSRRAALPLPRARFDQSAGA
jgi:hypothetical protein